MFLTSREINTWLNGINAKTNTREKYVFVINDYCKFLETDTKNLVKDYVADIKNGNLMPERTIFYDYPGYAGELKSRDLAPSTIKIYLSAVKSFLKYYYIDIPNNIKITRGKPLEANSNRFLKHEQIREIINSSYNIRNKAIILVMVSSGMAKNEVRNLKCNQIEFDKNDIGTIRLRREKAEHDYYTFISPEAIKALREYWEVRERSQGRSEFVFSSNDKNIQMSNDAFKKLFNRLNVRMGYEPGTMKNFSEIRSHAMRKFFSTSLQNAGMSKEDIDWLLGHVPDSTDVAYFSNSEVERLKSEYIKNLSVITFKDEIIIKSVDNEQFENQAKELEELKAQINAIQELLKLSSKHQVEV